MRSRIILVILSCVFSYGALEIAVSTYLGRYPVDAWVFEDSGRTIHFDRDRGYLLTQVPSRWARITNGAIAELDVYGRLDLRAHRVVEYIGTLKGNNHGFPDKHDFDVAHKEDGVKRFAVFGDSYTAAQYIETNWPDRVEEIYRSNGERIELYNFATDGGGVGNWHSTLMNVIRGANYRFDGLIFAVFVDDLNRPYLYSDHRNRKRVPIVYLRTFDANDRPRSLPEIQEALRNNEIRRTFILPTEEFDKVLSGERVASDGWKPQIASFLIRRFRKTARPDGPELARRHRDCGLWNCQQLRLLEDIRSVVEENRYRVIVFFLVGKSVLLDKNFDASRFRFFNQARVFAEMVGATFFDGRDAFRKMTAEQIDELFLRYDGHWNQRGSDTFARYAARVLKQTLMQ